MRVAHIYEARVQAGEIEADAAQRLALESFDRLLADLEHGQMARKSSALGWLFQRHVASVPRGLYVHGAVGRGKTMLMDLFFSALPARLPARRVHFHAFMREVHGMIHEWRQAHKRGDIKGDDPIAPVAAHLAQQARVLCFDEFHVTDIADAMILGRLFAALFAQGVVLVATSNVAPEDLYLNGLNRALFLPFIDLMLDRVEVVRLEARTDFRLEKLHLHPVWLVGEDPAFLPQVWADLTGGAEPQAMVIQVQGRSLPVPRCARGVAWFSFDALCNQPLGAADYLEIGSMFHTLLLEGIPVMGYEFRNVVKRFITLIDALYDLKVKLVATAAAAPSDLYTVREGAEAFAFARTVSRLMEMRSQDYLTLPHGGVPVASGDSTGLVET